MCGLGEANGGERGAELLDEGQPTWAKVFALGDEERLPGRGLTLCECRSLGLIWMTPGKHQNI